jgi:hypothetical protein
MADPTHQTPTWVILVVYATYVIVSMSIAVMIIQNITDLRNKTLRKFPARFRGFFFTRVTLNAMIIIFPSLLWPLIMATCLPIYFIFWLAVEVEKLCDYSHGRRGTEQQPDVELPVLNPNPYAGAQRRNLDGIDDGHQTAGGRPGIHMVPVTGPPPPYRPYPTVLETLQTQWLQVSDRDAERHIFVLNSEREALRVPEDLLQSARGGRVSADASATNTRAEV